MTPTAQALAEVLALAELATPGEWAWVERSGYLSIAAPHGGGTTVMDFCRRGTQGAQPRFGVSLDGEPRGRRGGVLLTAVELMARNPDGRLSHPDAELIIAAANFIRTHGPALLAQLGGGREVDGSPEQKLLVGFMLDCNAIGLRAAAENLHKGLKEEVAKRTTPTEPAQAGRDGGCA